MASKRLHILWLMLCFSRLAAQQSGGVEHLYYVKPGQTTSFVPMAYLNMNNNWYGELRYNFDELNTVSLYGGRKFSHEGKLSYSVTPIVGALWGQLQGGSVGVAMDAGIGKMFLISQSQYTFSMQHHTNRYFYNWTEVGYQPLKWIYGGMTVQQTSMYGEKGIFEPGCMVGFTIGQCTFPVYVFDPGSNANFVVGLIWEWEQPRKNPRTELTATKFKTP